MNTDQIVLVVLAVNAAVCAAVPVEIKRKAPALWGLLDALAANVGHATNRLDTSKKWQKGVAAAVLGYVLGSFGLTIAAQPPSSPVEPQTIAQTIETTPHVSATVLAPAPVSPADDASCATAVAQ